MILSWKKRALVFAAIFIANACKGPADSDLSAAADGSEKNTITFACEADKSDLGEKKAARRGDSGSKHKLSADWCFSPSSVSSLRVLYIIDISGSMRYADGAASCERLAAVKALTADIRAKAKQGDTVEFAAISFSTDASVITDFIGTDQFEGQISPEKYCEMNGGTNYEAAFSTATTLVNDLKSKLESSGEKTPVIAYFITDGFPSVGATDGIESAAELRKAMQSINEGSVLNALYLETSSTLVGGTPAFPLQNPAGSQTPVPSTSLPSSIPPEKTSEDARKLLADITGSADRVKTAANANELAGKLAEFKKPVATLDPATVKIDLVAGKDIKNFACDQQNQCAVTVDANDNGKWNISLTFGLSGEEGQEVDNVVTISGKRTDGSAIKAQGTVTFSSLR